MKDKNTILNKLEVFKKLEKFSYTEWQNRGLNPSSDEWCKEMNIYFNQCIDKLIFAINTDASQKKLKRIITIHLNSLHRSHFDTEEREFICDYFLELSGILSINISDHLNKWLYGIILFILIKLVTFFKKKEKILETHSQNCTRCNTSLDTHITKFEQGTSNPSWEIVQCTHCKEYNLLSLGQNIKERTGKNYTIVEHLLKSQFNEEQAKIRLEQIKYFRN